MRRRASWWAWLIGLLLGVTVLAGVVTTSFLRERFGPALRTYMGLLRAGDSDGAYEMLCSESKRAVTLEDFTDTFNSQIAEIGPIRDVDSLRGGKEVGSFVLEGERKTVVALIPAKHEGGKWRPCPRDNPLGEFRPPP